MPEQPSPIQFRTDETPIEKRTRADQSKNLTAKRDLERYYTLLRHETPTFPEAEARLIVDVHNGTAFQPFEPAARIVHANVEDAPTHYFEKWDVERAPLVERLKALSFAEATALIDAIERFWRNTDTTLDDVGLTHPSDNEAPSTNGSF